MEKHSNFSGTPPECVSRPYHGKDGKKRFLEHLHHHYYYEVVEKKHAYDLFVDSFLYGHKHHSSKNATHKNEHTRNLIIIRYLLTKRRDLVEKYFQTPLPLKDYEVVWSELKFDPADCDCNQALDILTPTTTNQEPTMRKAMPDEPETVARYPFGCRFSDEVIDILVRGINRLDMFSRNISNETLKRFLYGTLDKPLVCKNATMLSYLFYKLRKEKWIMRNWEQNMENTKLVYKRNGIDLIMAKNISPLLYATTCDRKRVQHYHITIDDMIARIKKYHMN